MNATVKETHMTIFGKTLSEYVSFCKPFMILIVVVGLLRLVLSLAGVPTSIDKWLSVTVAVWIANIYYAIRVHTSGFGSYKHLLPISALIAISAQAIIVSGLILAIATGKDNIYSVPEFAFGEDGKTWFHVGAHLVLGTTASTLLGWLVGCVIMFVTKKVTGKGKDTQATARA